MRPASARSPLRSCSMLGAHGRASKARSLNRLAWHDLCDLDVDCPRVPVWRTFRRFEGELGLCPRFQDLAGFRKRKIRNVDRVCMFFMDDVTRLVLETDREFH